MEMEKKDTKQKVMQPVENIDIECNKRPSHPTANKATDKREVHKHKARELNENDIGINQKKPKKLCYFWDTMILIKMKDLQHQKQRWCY